LDGDIYGSRFAGFEVIAFGIVFAGKDNGKSPGFDGKIVSALTKGLA
jgi:hypothetical protein